MPKPMKPAKPKPRAVVAAVKADQLFAYYFALGPNRTLERLVEVARTYGVQTSLTAVKGYSARNEWQRRLQEASELIRDSITDDQVRNVADMNRQQAAAGALGVQLAMLGLERMLAQLRRAEACDKCGIAPLDLAAGDVSLVMNSFAKWQRTALGQATERKDFGIVVYNTILPEIGDLFKAINGITDPVMRTREFAVGVNAITNRHLELLTGG